MLFRRTKSHPEAEHALAQAQANLQVIQSRGPEVEGLAQASRRLRSENHFAEQLREIVKDRGRRHDRE